MSSWDHGMDDHQAAHRIQCKWRARSAMKSSGPPQQTSPSSRTATPAEETSLPAGVDPDSARRTQTRSAINHGEGVLPTAEATDAPVPVPPTNRDETSVEEPGIRGYTCEYLCGFYSVSFDEVAQHELRCPQAR
jgi:hypothetical protein